MSYYFAYFYFTLFQFLHDIWLKYTKLRNGCLVVGFAISSFFMLSPWGKNSQADVDFVWEFQVRDNNSTYSLKKKKPYQAKQPASTAQLDAGPTGDQVVAGSSTAGSATSFRGDCSWNVFFGHSLLSVDSRRAVVSFWRKNVHNTV